MEKESSKKGNSKLADEKIEDSDDEIDDWCESFVEPEDKMTDADRQVSEWCRLESKDKKKKEDNG